MSLEKKIKKVCGNSSEVSLVSLDLTEMTAEIMVPYEGSSTIVDLTGNSEKEILESFIEEVNLKLDSMINHLNDCKLSES